MEAASFSKSLFSSLNGLNRDTKSFVDSLSASKSGFRSSIEEPDQSCWSDTANTLGAAVLDSRVDIFNFGYFLAVKHHSSLAPFLVNKAGIQAHVLTLFQRPVVQEKTCGACLGEQVHKLKSSLLD
ncbi:hypothetical protein BpHYR1_040980 [Brachionus plicatilis]|uniref:Uncharacterized protein n=1 Tax=Brachionus plicatilis TaxID=10195 RepID=A0A3M7R6S1_BRAPC|nr:hypothetical protein BpHYR1_040980 [Brachionus plicatilis]